MTTRYDRIMVPLKDTARYTITDTEDGRDYVRTLPAGRHVMVDGWRDPRDGVAYVVGISRPTMHGGGVHVSSARDLDTGELVPTAIIDAYELNYVVAHMIKARRAS